uniref:Ligand dependent nuclear receptor corepressor n=1 Tax=Salvator merianae TaxID=96440 RepID=A0A8D0KN60_SALMN
MSCKMPTTLTPRQGFFTECDVETHGCHTRCHSHPLQAGVQWQNSAGMVVTNGVLDLSTKKSPCAGSASLSHSPGCSATPGNGEDTADTIAIDCLGQPKSPLEKFMVRLCTYHQKHFVRVLNDICTEVQTGCEGKQLPGPESMDVSTCSSGCSQYHSENQELITSCSESKLPSSLDPEQSGPHGSLRILCHALKQAVDLKSTERRENCSSVGRRDFQELPSIRTNSASPRENSTQGYLTASNSRHSAKSLEGQSFGCEQEMETKKGEDDKDQMQNRALLDGYIAVKSSNVNTNEDSLEGRMGPQKNPYKSLLEDTREPTFTGSSPRRADKENALQCSSKPSLLLDTEMNDQEARSKGENHLQASGKSKGSYNIHPVDKTHVDNAKDSWLPNNPMSHHKATNGHSRAKNNSAFTKSTRKSKRSSGLRINDYDNQCDVVYISQPITECHFENKRAVTSRKTARKSTRGYYYNGECCELPTVRTLAKTSQMQESGNMLASRPEAQTVLSQGVVVPSASSLATARAMLCDDADKRSFILVPSQGDSPIKNSQEGVESCLAESNSSEMSLTKCKEINSTEVSILATSQLPCPTLHSEESSLIVPLLQTTVSSSPPQSKGELQTMVASSPQQSEGELQDKIDTNTVLQVDDGMASGQNERLSEGRDNIEVSEMLSVSEAVNSEEGSSLLKDETTSEPSILTDEEPSVSTVLLPPEELAAKIDLLPPLEESASVEDLPASVESFADAEPPLLSPVDLAEAQAEPPALINLEPSVDLSEELFSESMSLGEFAANSGTVSPDVLPANVEPEPPANVELMPSNVPSTDSLSSHVDMDGPQTLTDSEAAELSGNLQYADACEKINVGNSIEEAQDCEENQSKKSQNISLIEDIGEEWKEEVEMNISEMNNGKEADNEAPLVPGASESGSEGGVSSKTNPEKKRKRERKTQVASDRCLRSQRSLSPPEDSSEQPNSPPALQLPQLQIKLSKSPGGKRFKREVHLDGAASVCFPSDQFHKILLNNIGSALEQQSDEGNDITMRQTYKAPLAKKAVIDEGQGGEGDKTDGGKNLEICLEADSNKRSVHVPVDVSDKSENQADLKVGAPESITDVAEMPQIQHGTPSPGSRNENKQVLLVERTVKYKKPALQFYNLRNAPAPVASATKSTSGKEVLQEGTNITGQQNAPDEDLIGFSSMSLLSENKPQFVEWCAEEENQELITNFNAQYMKVQKGWIQLEKEVQPAPKVKNKSDKLKEIWKSKKRTRKLKGSSEIQKLSPVQMLFMRPLEIPNICRWFMETTETKSLVIVKKLNTRLPGDVPLIKLPLQKACSSGIYPSSVQAERLKKHLKKFAAMTPAKNTIKTQRVWARLRESTEETEQEQVAAAKQTPPSEVRPEPTVETKNAQPPPNIPAQTSSRILRKYSNLRGKLRGLQRLPKQDRSDGAAKHPAAESKPSDKSLCIKPLMSPKPTQQVKAATLPAKPSPVERGQKGRKGKGKIQEDTALKGSPQQGRKKPGNESSRLQGTPSGSSKERLPLKKPSKPKLAGALATRKYARAERSNKSASKNEKTKKKIVPLPGKKKSPPQKGTPKPYHKATQPSKPEGLSKPLKPKVRRDSSSQSLKVTAKKANSSKAQTRSMKRVQENNKTQSKRKLRANKDSSASKRRRLETK